MALGVEPTSSPEEPSGSTEDMLFSAGGTQTVDGGSSSDPIDF